MQSRNKIILQRNKLKKNVRQSLITRNKKFQKFSSEKDLTNQELKANQRRENQTERIIRIILNDTVRTYF